MWGMEWRGGSEPEQPLHAIAVAAGDLGLVAEVALPLRGLLLEDVVLERLAPHHLAGAGDLEALGRAAVGLHLRHRGSSFVDRVESVVVLRRRREAAARPLRPRWLRSHPDPLPP